MGIPILNIKKIKIEFISSDKIINRNCQDDCTHSSCNDKSNYHLDIKINGEKFIIPVCDRHIIAIEKGFYIDKDIDIDYDAYMRYCQRNRCFNKKCISCKAGVCDDFRGIKDCKSRVLKI